MRILSRRSVIGMVKWVKYSLNLEVLPILSLALEIQIFPHVEHLFVPITYCHPFGPLRVPLETPRGTEIFHLSPYRCTNIGLSYQCHMAFSGRKVDVSYALGPLTKL